MRIGSADVPALERGVALLGSGGGGETGAATALLRHRISAGHRVALTPVAELDGDALVVPVGVIGATSVFDEKPPSGAEFFSAVAAVRRWTGRGADALMSIEVGGLNGVLPLVAAVDLGVPCVDADQSGRGVPRLDQLAVAAVGGEVAPVALAEPGGHVLVLAEGSAAEVERTARAFLAGAGGWAAMAMAPIRAAELPGCALLGTVGAALDLGRRALSAGERPADLAAATGAGLLGVGRVVEVARRSGPGFGRGSLTVRDRESLLRLEMENEYLLALRDGAPVASTPDVLAVVDRRTGVPVPCDAARTGVEVAVLRLPAAEFWTDPRRLPVLAPRAFGIDCDPVLL
ncbi:DUF917 domain-containing protein [Saccharopolyspora rosea]|uniref:DUF917 domain-containing protein n=1 Tax=Saccharopolyspora rosea TaxID=524884 RepID=A0ABW3FM43_9PSEU|nr:DUF917 domain-containing protein [Saccharopolyspora rosea]